MALVSSFYGGAFGGVTLLGGVALLGGAALSGCD